MTKYVLDTNLYIRATRDGNWNRRLVAFYSTHTPFIHLHSVTTGELLAGAIRPGLEEETHRNFIRPFEAVGRVITPSHAAWRRRAGQVVSALIRRGALSPGGVKHSFFNDCLIAASCREHGFVVITDDTRDFELISSVEPVRFVRPWPWNKPSARP